MTNAPVDFAANARRAESLLTSALDSWKNGLTSVTDQFRAFPSVGTLPQVDATEVVERQFGFVKQIVDLNYQYARQLAEVANTLTVATREHVDSFSGAVRDQVQTVAEAGSSNVDKVEQAVREAADQAEEAKREQERAAAKAEREDRKEARDQSRERYQALKKEELVEEASKRNLPKTGTVDELVERLVADDTK